MTAYSWTTGVSGDWSNAADWTGGGIPDGSTADVTIAATGTYTVTIGVGESFTVGTLGLDDAGATLLVAGTLDLAGTLTLTAGALDLNGTIAGGMIVDPDGALVATGGAFDGVTYQGLLDLSGDFLRLSIEKNLAMTGAAGTGNGTILDTGYSAGLLATANATISAATIDLGNDFATPTLGVADSTGAGVVLTLGSVTSVVQSGSFATLAAGFYSGDAIVNQGAIDAGWTDGSFTIGGNGFTNAGTLTLDGGTLDLAVYSFANTGSITVTSGTLDFDATHFVSTGSFTVANGAAIDIESNLTLAQLDTIVAAADSVTLAGTLDLAGGTLLVGSGTALGTVTVSGTIADGILDNPENGLDFDGATLENTTLDGTLDIANSGARLTLASGLTTDGTGGATLDVSGNDASIDMMGSATLSGLTLDLSSSGNYYGSQATIEAESATGVATKITLAGNDVVDVTDNGEVWYGATAGDALINRGTIEVDSEFSIDTASFINDGRIIAGGSVYIGDGAHFSSFTNAGTITLTAGTLGVDVIHFTDFKPITVMGGSSLDITATYFSDMGNITVESGGSLNLAVNHLSGSGVISLLSGSNIGLGGNLTTAQLEAFQASGADVTIDGVLDNSGQTLTVGSGGAVAGLDLQGTLDGGTVADPSGAGLDLNGTIDGSTIIDPDGAASFSGYLRDVTYEGSAMHAGDLVISGALSITGAGEKGAGVLYANGDLESSGNVSLNDLTIYFNGSNFIGVDDPGQASHTLTIDHDTTIALDGDNQYATLGSANDIAGDKIVNDGTISLTDDGGFNVNLAITAPIFTNDGTLDVGPLNYVTLQPTDFTNLVEGTLTRGSYVLHSDSKITLNPNTRITTDDAEIFLDPGTVIQSEDTATSSEITIDTTLRRIAAGGSLDLAGGRNWTGAVTFTNDGLLVIDGGTFTEKALVNASGATIRAEGSISNTIDNDGSIEAYLTGVTVSGAVGGTGSLEIDSRATLQLRNTVASTQTVTFDSGEDDLELGDPTGFHATLSGFASGDRIDLSDFAYAKSETLSYTPNSGDTGGVLRIVDGSLIARLTLFGQYVASGFDDAADGGGTAITYTPPAAEHPKLAAHG